LRAITELLGDRRLVVISNRAPVDVSRGPERRYVPTVGGMVSALMPVFQAAGRGLWIAWSGGEMSSKSRERIQLPPDNPCFTLRWVPLSERDVSGSYYGFSNRGLWPLSHYFVGRCQFRVDQWQSYRRVNEVFAKVVLAERQDNDLVWVQDFHLATLPGMLREGRRDMPIGFFWHVPFPEPSVFGILPWRTPLLQGMLGSDVIGFHLESYARNFLACVERFVGAPVDYDHGTVRFQGRDIRVVAWPIGTDAQQFEALARSPEVQMRAGRIRRQLGSARMVLGVDRLDYTKGILERLQGFERFLEQSPNFRRQVTFLQIAVPSRERVDEYRRMKREIDEAVGRLAGRFTAEGWVPVRYMYRSVPAVELAAHYVAADLAMVTPLRDGMNLVAKEYVATRVNDDGILMLSEFAGAAADLDEAVRVNPYNVDDVASQIRLSLTMPAAEVRARMSRLRARVKDQDIRWWLQSFLGEFPLASGDMHLPTVVGTDLVGNRADVGRPH
jgi:trehalose 6-phosphate synthase/phosphatase